MAQRKQVASTFAARVADARRALPRLSGTREVSQAEVAARTGWSQQRYSKIESGSQKTISVEDLQVLAAALDEDPYFLFTGLRTQNVGSLAARIDRLELDSWGEDAVWETAQRAKAEVAAWPAWKRGILGASSKSQWDEPRRPVDNDADSER